MIAWNKMWEEIKEADVKVRCILWYTDQQRRWNRWYNVFIAFTASVGALGYGIDKNLPFIATLLIGLVSLTKSIFPHLLQSEQDLCTLDGLTDFYRQYKAQLEEIYYKFEKKIYSENQAMSIFFPIKEAETPKASLMNKLIRHIPKKKVISLEVASTDYLNRVYMNKYPNENETEN